MFGSSLAVFLQLVRRWTTRRRWVSLAEWASERRMRVARQAITDLPPPLDQLAKLNHHPRVRLRVDERRRRRNAGRTTIIQFETSDRDGQAGPIWNILIRRLDDGRPRVPAGLRPARVAASVIDLFALTTFNSLSNDRFAVLALDGRTAQQLNKSSARALLPPDVGLLLHGEHLVLDFSARPFDPTELDRLLSVADQIVTVV
jgi:hypothetical protein